MTRGLVAAAAVEEALEVFAFDAPADFIPEKYPCHLLSFKPADNVSLGHGQDSRDIGHLKEFGCTAIPSCIGLGLAFLCCRSCPITFAGVAPLVGGLQVVDAISASLRSRDDVVCMHVIDINRLTAQSAQAGRFVPEVYAQRTQVFGRVYSGSGPVGQPRLEQEWHRLRVSRSSLLEDVDDLAVDRTVLARSYVSEPLAQFLTQSKDDLGVC